MTKSNLREHMADLQKLLKGVYSERWSGRNDAAKSLNRALYEVEEYRKLVGQAQTALEEVAQAWRETGDVKAHDYFERVWPLAKPEERPTGPSIITNC